MLAVILAMAGACGCWSYHPAPPQSGTSADPRWSLSAGDAMGRSLASQVQANQQAQQTANTSTSHEETY